MIFGIRFNIFVWLGILILFFVILLILLKGVLIYQYTNSSTDQVLGEGKEKFKENRLKEKNGDVISFLLGNILPAVFIIEE
ncbi:TPA: antibiotic resistance protein VanZ, partial [Staphylococcus pseudintermedius]